MMRAMTAAEHSNCALGLSWCCASAVPAVAVALCCALVVAQATWPVMIMILLVCCRSPTEVSTPDTSMASSPPTVTKEQRMGIVKTLALRELEIAGIREKDVLSLKLVCCYKVGQQQAQHYLNRWLTWLSCSCCSPGKLLVTTTQTLDVVTGST